MADLEELKARAEKGDASAQFEYAMQLISASCIIQALRGGETSSVSEKYYSEAVFWLQNSAVQGNIHAQFNLAESYYNGHGIEKNLSEAFYWYNRSAKAGLVEAQTRLGDCYGFGYGVEANDSLAFHWYKEAADKDDARAKCCLATFYANGIVVPRDDNKAIRLLREALSSGNSEAKFLAKRGLEKLGISE